MIEFGEATDVVCLKSITISVAFPVRTFFSASRMFHFARSHSCLVERKAQVSQLLPFHSSEGRLGFTG